MTAVPGAARSTSGSCAPSASPEATGPIASGMTAMIHRLLGGYAVAGLLPGVPALVAQAPAYPRPWVLAVLLVGAVLVAGMVVQAVRGRTLGGWLPAFAAYTLLGVWSMSAFTGSGLYPFLWFHVGLAVVCACVWGGLRLGTGYGLLLGAGWAHLRLTPGGGGVSAAEAVGEALFGVSAGLVIGVVALGMLTSARSADAVASRLREQEVRQAVDRAVADERARLDQLIHDDVMTTLTAAAQGTDAATEQATSLLARETLAAIDAMGDADEAGDLSVAVLVSLVEQTVRRVSPDVGWTADVRLGAAPLRVPGPVAQTLLSAVREAVRNAVRHSGEATVTVGLDARRVGADLALQARVVDDGRGFDSAHLPLDRLGVRRSMLEASHQVGLVTRLQSRPGHGTTYTVSWTGRPQVLTRLMPQTDVGEDEPRLPVDFPAHRFSAVTWVALVVNVAVGVLTLDAATHRPPFVVAVVVAAVAMAVVLRPGAGLELPAGSAAGVVVAVAAVQVLMALAHPERADGVFEWHSFVVQLVLVVLVVRRRLGWAALGVLVTETTIVLQGLAGLSSWPGVVSRGSGPVLLVAMALLVNRVLLAIGRRQGVLRREEDEAVDASVRRHVARVQRALWLADLRTQVRSVLLRLAGVRGSVPDDLRHEALMLEATLRESIVARNVMSDELADLTEAARRRGVEVRLVDSRSTTVPPRVAQAVLEVVRRALAAESVRRLVVRLAPEEGSTTASVLSEDAHGTHLVRLDALGTPAAQEIAVDTARKVAHRAP
ncbi:Signal transduction histidine kinase [Microlunatus sagamiharensis]|uniref:Signal transduction histidine kinase n=1 Tax=Microlunatus sagamiharensis TaxID=546874 RepID=A0A1H2M8K5_9ACTN|nr:ATP-binding protein [Microlunatus sagamiharensis]SDU89577.1 Signal transduction histidine kinase [Microlunatus sagamiharensis]